MKAVTYIGLVIALLVAPIASTASAAERASKQSARGKAAASSRGQSPDAVVDHLKKRYRQGNISSRELWVALNTLVTKKVRLTRNGQAGLLQLQGHLLLKAGYPVAAAMYVADALKAAPDPFDPGLSRAWGILASVSRARPIQYVLEDLAGEIKIKDKLPPYFDNDWYYVLGNSWADKGRDDLAEAYFKKLNMGDRYFLPAQFQIAIMRINAKDDEKAELALKTILSQTALEVSPIKDRDKIEMTNYAHMALGRLYYQDKQFLDSVRQYRQVPKTSPLFYDALFEQAWALFMSGNPQHSLGALYGSASPFFANAFNPEAKVLEAIVYYWMCRYEDSRNSLADFAEHHGDAVESLSAFLDRQRLRPETAYQLFEDLISGVSSSALGIPRNVLLTAANRDSMLLVRDQYATVTGEKSRLTALGVFKLTAGADRPIAELDRVMSHLKTAIGKQFLVELQSLKDHYDDLYSQSQFLYLELLMS